MSDLRIRVCEGVSEVRNGASESHYAILDRILYWLASRQSIEGHRGASPGTAALCRLWQVGPVACESRLRNVRVPT